MRIFILTVFMLPFTCCFSMSEQDRSSVSKGIMSMYEEDQFLRNQVVLDWDVIGEKDRLHAEELKKIICEFGWPEISLFGEQISRCAWLIVQHADHDVEFQEYCLGLIEKALKNNNVDPLDYVYLYDRVKRNKSELQLYGTQVLINVNNGQKSVDVYPLEDPKKVDERRAKFGMSSLAEYLKKFVR